MRKMRWQIRLLAAALLSAPLSCPVVAASTAGQVRDCRDDNGQDRCVPQAQARQRALYGAAAAESLGERRVTTLRAFYVDGYGRDVGLVSFQRAPGEEPRVEALTPAFGEAAAPGGALSSVVPVATWDRLVTDAASFDRELAPRPGGAPPEICLHSWVATVEAVDPDGRVRRRTEGACGGGLAIRFAFQLARAAVDALPACALLDPEKSRNDVTRLADCRMLAGDRAAAAQAYNRLRSTWFLNPRGPDFARVLHYLFFEQADIAWPGEAPVRGGEAAAKLWSARVGESPFFISRVFGETADRVRVEGNIVLNGRVPDATAQRVPATMIWTRENGFDFRLRSLTSGDSGKASGS